MSKNETIYNFRTVRALIEMDEIYTHLPRYELTEYQSTARDAYCIMIDAYLNRSTNLFSRQAWKYVRDHVHAPNA